MNNWNKNNCDLRNNLKTGHVVRTRSNDLFFVIKDCDTELHDHQEFCLINSKRILYKANFNCDLNAYPTFPSSNPDDIMMVYGGGKICTNAFSFNVEDMPIIWKRTLKEVKLEDIVRGIQDKYGDEIFLTCENESIKKLVEDKILGLRCCND